MFNLPPQGPPWADHPRTTSFPSLVYALPWAKISRRSHHPALIYPQPYKQTNKQTKSKLNITPNATLWRDNNVRLKIDKDFPKLLREVCCDVCCGSPCVSDSVLGRGFRLIASWCIYDFKCLAGRRSIRQTWLLLERCTWLTRHKLVLVCLPFGVCSHVTHVSVYKLWKD